MNREIKFRAWDKEAEQMVYRDLETFAKFGCPFIPMQEAIVNGSIMQYTGLKDTNDKELWTGDIVKCKWTYTKPLEIKIPEIYYIANEFCAPDGIEIIGNVWENPELLEDK